MPLLAKKQMCIRDSTQIVAFGHALLTGFDALRRALVVDERKRTDLDGRTVVQRGCIDDGTVDPGAIEMCIRDSVRTYTHGPGFRTRYSCR